MAGGHGLGAKLLRRVEQIGELHPLIAGDAGDRRFAARIGGCEILHHRLFEAGFVIQHVMGNAERFGHTAGIVDVLAGAAGALLLHGGAVIVELQRHAHDIVAGARQQRRRDRRIHPAGHGRDDPHRPDGPGKGICLESAHGPSYRPGGWRHQGVRISSPKRGGT